MYKNIFKRIIVGVAVGFILMNLNKCNVSALINKTSLGQNPVFNPRQRTGVIASGGWAELTFPLASTLTLNGTYDYIGIQLNGSEFRYSSEITINSTGAYCEKYAVDNNLVTNPPEHVYYQIRCIDTTGQVGQTGGSLNNQGDVYNFYALMTSSNNVEKIPCFFTSENADILFCPTKNEGVPIEMTGIVFYVNNQATTTLTYKIALDNIKNYYNESSTEIVNGLTGVQQAQQQTVDTITDSNINGANSSSNTALSGISTDVNSTLNASISPNQLYTILSSFTNQLSTSTCSPITLPIPYTNENIILPCLGTEFSQRIPVIWALYELIITGVIVLRFWQHGVEFVLNVLDPYHIGANNIPNGGGK